MSERTEWLRPHVNVKRTGHVWTIDLAGKLTIGIVVNRVDGLLLWKLGESKGGTVPPLDELTPVGSMDDAIDDAIANVVEMTELATLYQSVAFIVAGLGKDEQKERA